MVIKYVENQVFVKWSGQRLSHERFKINQNLITNTRAAKIHWLKTVHYGAETDFVKTLTVCKNK